MAEKSKKTTLSEERAPYGGTLSIGTDTIESRIKEVSEALDGVPRLAEMTGISQSQLYRQISGESEIKVPHLVAIARAGGVTVEWLATGAGPKHPGEMVSAEDYAFIPLYDVGAAAGHGAFVDEKPSSDALAFKRDWLRQQIGARTEDLAIINVRGDSMEPTLHDRDVIMINRAESKVSEGIYVFLIDGWLRVKRLSLQLGDEGKMEIHASSDNPARPSSEVIDLEGYSEKTRIIGRVVWAGRRF